MDLLSKTTCFYVSIMFVCLLYTGQAIKVDTVGREFIFAYPTPYYPTSSSYSYSSYVPVLYVVITNAGTTDCTTSVSIGSTGENPFRSIGVTNTVTTTQATNITISFRDYFGNSFYNNIEEPKTIKVIATGDVSVFAFYSYNQRYSTWYTTGTVIMPTTALGKEYFTASYKPVTGQFSEFTVTALSDATHVKIRGTDGYRFSDTLQPYQTLQYRSRDDLTGSSITADKPVSVMSGASAVKVPDYEDYPSYILAHLPSINSLGKTYALGSFKYRSSGYVFRVVGTQDNSIMMISGLIPIELHAGDMYEQDVNADNVIFISSTKPILVYEFSKGFNVENSKGNVAMVLIPAIEMFSTSVTFPITLMPSLIGTQLFSLSITIKCEADTGLLFDGIPLAQVLDKLIGPSGMCILRMAIPLPKSSYRISHSAPDVTFSVMVYGMGYKVGYAYMAGYNVRSRTSLFQDNSTYQIPETSKGMTLICDDTKMTIFVNKSFIIDGQPSDVHLNDPFCYGQLITKNWIGLEARYTECGTAIEENESGFTYSNTLIYEGPQDQNVLIGRDATFQLPVTCDFQDRALASLRLAPELSVVNGRLTGHGAIANVTFKLQMYHGRQFSTAYRQDEFPVTVHVGELMYLEAVASSSTDYKILVESCLATPTSDQRQKPNYMFIDNGCPTDNTVRYIQTKDSSTERFSLIAFALFDADNPVATAYIHCWLIACNASEISSRCSKDCDSRERRNTNSDKDDNNYVVSWGPLIILPKFTHENNADAPNKTAFQIVPVIASIAFFIFGIIVSVFSVVIFQRSKQTRHRLHRNNDETYELLKMADPQE